MSPVCQGAIKTVQKQKALCPGTQIGAAAARGPDEGSRPVLSAPSSALLHEGTGITRGMQS